MQLANCLWPDPNAASGYSPILTGGVTISEDDEGNFLPTEMFPDEPAATATLPFAIVRLAGAVYDPEVEGLITSARVHCRITAGAGGIAASAVNEASTHGQDSLVGGPLGTDGWGGSTGRGLDDIWPEIIAQAFNKGAHINDRSFGYDGWLDQASQVDNTDGSQIMTREFDVVIINALASRYYHNLWLLAATAPGGGVASLTFVKPPLRFDTAGLVYAYKAGSTAPTVFGAGGQTNSTLQPTTSPLLITTGAGQVSITVWVVYDERMPGPPAAAYSTLMRLSAPMSVTVTVS
jgi:hypothetical protein